MHFLFKKKDSVSPHFTVSGLVGLNKLNEILCLKCYMALYCYLMQTKYVYVSLP